MTGFILVHRLPAGDVQLIAVSDIRSVRSPELPDDVLAGARAVLRCMAPGVAHESFTRVPVVETVEEIGRLLGALGLPPVS